MPTKTSAKGAAAAAPSATDIAWMAGLLEGEGSFNRNGVYRKDGSHDWKVTLKMGDRDVVERFKTVAGVHHKLAGRNDARHSDWSMMYTVAITGPEARRIARLVLPHMGLRRAAKIREMLAMDESWHAARAAA